MIRFFCVHYFVMHCLVWLLHNNHWKFGTTTPPLVNWHTMSATRFLEELGNVKRNGLRRKWAEVWSYRGQLGGYEYTVGFYPHALRVISTVEILISLFFLPFLFFIFRIKIFWDWNFPAEKLVSQRENNDLFFKRNPN